jgi:hypothetical protein
VPPLLRERRGSFGRASGADGFYRKATRRVSSALVEVAGHLDSEDDKVN